MLDFGFYNADCMQGMKEFPDNYFDLAIVDPPYGGVGKDVDETFNGAIQGRFGGRFEKYFNSGGVSTYQEQAVHGRVSTGKK
jgi:DNA modification methylase